MSAPTVVVKKAAHDSEQREVPVFGYEVTVQTAEFANSNVTLLHMKDHNGLSFRLYLSNAEAFQLAHELMRGVRPA